MKESELIQLRRVYAEVCRGYGILTWRDQTIYLKHLDTFDQIEIDSAYQEALREAVEERRIKTEQDRLTWLEARNLWTKENELSVAQQKSYIEGLEKGRSKAMFASQMDQLDKQLGEARGQLDKLLKKRQWLLGMTAEIYADRKTQYEHMRLAFHKDTTFQKPMHDRMSIQEVEDNEMDEMLVLYIAYNNALSLDTLKKIVLQPFFSNLFHLCGEEPARFFDKAVSKLTLAQGTLLSYASYYKRLIASYEGNLPAEVMTDPRRLEDYIMQSRNINRNLAKLPQGDHVYMKGATTQDLKDHGLPTEQGEFKVYRSIHEAIKDRGAVDRK